MAQILIDGKPLEETIWEVDGKTIPGDKAFATIAFASPLVLPAILGSGFVGYLLGKKKKRR